MTTTHLAHAVPPHQRNHPHHGMPPLDEDGPPLSFFEFWPVWAFYPPVMAYAAWQMLRHRSILLPTAYYVLC